MTPEFIDPLRGVNSVDFHHWRKDKPKPRKIRPGDTVLAEASNEANPSWGVVVVAGTVITEHSNHPSAGSRYMIKDHFNGHIYLAWLSEMRRIPAFDQNTSVPLFIEVGGGQRRRTRGETIDFFIKSLTQ